MMDYSLILSLEHMAAVRVIVTLWNQVDVSILASLSDYHKDQSDAILKELENKVEGKLQNLSLQEELIEKLSGFIKPIGIRILRWIKSYKKILRDYSKLKTEYLISIIRLTSKGTIDERETAKILVKNEKLDINLRFRLACTYCIEDYIYTLWEKVDGKKFHDKNLKLISEQEPCLISFWVHYIQEKLVKLDNIEAKKHPYKYGFECAIEKHCIYRNSNEFLYDTTPNEVAANYFLQKLTFEEKQRELVGYAKLVMNYIYSTNEINIGYYADILCFLLSIMNEEQREEIFKKCSYEILVCLLYWPWQIFFAETAERILNFEDNCFPKDCYENLLMKISDKVRHGYKDWNYQELLGIFWKQTPHCYKRYIVNKLSDRSSLLLIIILKASDKQNIGLILDDATVGERENIIFASKINLWQHLIYQEKWDLIKFFIEKCISSKDLMIKFKQKLNFLTEINSAKLIAKREKWDKFFRLLDDIIRIYNKN